MDCQEKLLKLRERSQATDRQIKKSSQVSQIAIPPLPPQRWSTGRGTDMIQQHGLSPLFIFQSEKTTSCQTNLACHPSEFVSDAKPGEVVINGVPMTAEVKEFSTGSPGWYFNGKANIKVGEKSVSVQIGMNLTIVGSKELPKE